MKSFRMMYSNLGLSFRETLPLIATGTWNKRGKNLPDQTDSGAVWPTLDRPFSITRFLKFIY